MVLSLLFRDRGLRRAKGPRANPLNPLDPGSGYGLNTREMMTAHVPGVAKNGSLV